jgi:hypothetical protein
MNAIRKGIEEALKDFIRAPFQIIREAGLSNEIGRAISVQLDPNISFYEMQFPNGNKTFSPLFPKGKTSRVQYEMKVPVSTIPETIKTVDIAILKCEKSVHLECRKGGPGDVVAKLRVEDVFAAIEVKASPSSRSDQRRAYEADILALSALSNVGIFAVFVIVDKSLELFGSWSPERKFDGWLKGECWEIRECDADSLPPGGGWVEVWDIETGNNGWAPRVRHVKPSVP